MFRPGVSILTGMRIRGYKSYRKVGARLGYHENNVSSWVSGRRHLSLHALKDLATLFNVPLSTFIRWGESEIDIELLKKEVFKWQR